MSKLKWADNPTDSRYWTRYASCKEHGILYFIVKEGKKHSAHGRRNGYNFFGGSPANKSVAEFEALIEKHFKQWLKDNVK